MRKKKAEVCVDTNDKRIDIAKHTGLIAFVDILGYKEICNQSDIIQKRALLLLSKIPIITKRMLGEQLPVYEILDKIDAMVISDSIIISFPLSEENDDIGKFAETLIFLVYVRNFTDDMFEMGLPTRGAVCYGEYHKGDKSMSGLPLVRAYQLAESLDFSGVALTLHIENEFLCDSFIKGFIKESLLTRYNTKSKIWKDRNTLCLRSCPISPLAKRINSYVYSRFTEFGKKVDEEHIYKKLENTIAYLEHCKKQRKANATKKRKTTKIVNEGAL